MLLSFAKTFLPAAVALTGIVSVADARSVARPRATTCNGFSEVRKGSRFPVRMNGVQADELLPEPIKWAQHLHTYIHASSSPALTVVQLCSKSFGNVTLVGAHDSYAVGANNCTSSHSHLIS